MSSTTRAITLLDGTWNLEVLDDSGSVETTALVEVPQPWTVQVPGYGDSHATVRYTHRFSTEIRQFERLFVRFGAVNYSSSVTLNGTFLGTHEGAWLPFEFDATNALVDGENVLVVEVGYPSKYGSETERGFLEVPHGKQSWYGTTAGIWQSVSLEQRSALHVRDLSVRAHADSATIVVNPVLSLSDDSAEVRATVRFGGQIVGTNAAPAGAELTVQVTEPLELWDIDCPNLYEVIVDVLQGEQVVDAQIRETGFRTMETRDGKFLLNGKEIEIRAVLDQDYHPNSSSAPESTEALEDLFRKTRELGFNMLRVHIKRPDPRYYELADKLGILVWTELPSWLTWSPEVAHDGVELLKKFIAHDQHHPSIVIWTVINESWGMDMRSAKQRAWLKSAFLEVKEAAVGSLVVDNSACLPNFHVKSDIDDYHLYRGIPESRREWDQKIAEFASRPAWSYSEYGDAERSGTEPLMLSEFGNWGLPYTLDQFKDGEEPWWFAIGADWAFGAAEGTDLLNRFELTGLKGVFGTWNNFVSAVQRVQLIANRYQTTCIRSHPSISGYVVTQLSDVEWEANGLFDAQRTPKQFSGEYALANGDYAVVLRPRDYSVYLGEQLTLDLTVVPSRTGKLPAVARGQIRIYVDGQHLTSHDVPVDVWDRLVEEIEMPRRSAQYEVSAELWVDGTLVARDAADVLVVPARESVPKQVEQPLIAADSTVAAWLAELGYLNISTALPVPEEAEKLSASQIRSLGTLVTTRLDAAAQAFARNGGRVLVLAEDEHAFDDSLDFLPSARLGSRSGDGDWVPRNEWLHRTGPFEQVPGDTILGIAFEDLLGPIVVNGMPNMMRPVKHYSGIFNGWLRGQATTTAQFRWSEGAITVTTLRIRSGLVKAPIARVVGHAMVEAAGE